MKLAFILIAGLLYFLPYSYASSHMLPQPAATGSSDESRTRLNFNADWRFVLADVPGAAMPDFNDATWERVGLPHSFSLPYFQATSFYVGYGWYRKTFTLPRVSPGRRLSLEFEGVFQAAEVFVNGVQVGQHRGGYTGFSVDVTAAAHPGRNVVAVRVNNKWDPTLAPRAGEHVFSGGIYRDVWLVSTDAVHVAWTGTRITTPEISSASSRVEAETEIRNDSARPSAVTVHSLVVDSTGATVSSLRDQEMQVDPGQTVFARQLSDPISHPHLWSPEEPTLYRVVTTLGVAHRERDRFETEFGFRWISWTADKGFFLNGNHRYFKGANAHQDQAGWGDAVTNRAIDRDVQWIKDAGFDFIRGSHYPHDPHFAEATDRIGMLFLSEVPFWGTAGFKSDWAAPAYPADPAQADAFDTNVLQQLTEMIRINRNHPSIIAWGMDNEVFFTSKASMPRMRQLLSKESQLTRELDPTRPASIDGAQRGDIDHLGDIVGYNGDGAALFPNPGIPNFVSEYGSTISDRPGNYAPGWGDDLDKTPGATADDPSSWRVAWRSGEVIWAGFDHGSIAGRKFGSMGLVDYERLPKRSWYWYRNAYRGVPPPAWPKEGVAAALRLTSSAPAIEHADGTDDVQLIVSVLDGQGQAISNSPPVRLTIESGPGELPTGRSIDFAPDSDIFIRDGQAAIAMRSWQKGTSRVRATSAGLRDAVLDIRTLEGPTFVPGVTPLVADRPYHAYVPEAVTSTEQAFGTNSPTSASSSTAGHSSQLVDDGDPATSWIAAAGDASPTITIDPERILEYHRLQIVFPQPAGYGFTAEVRNASGQWVLLAEELPGIDSRQVREMATQQVTGRPMRLTLKAPAGAVPGVAEVHIFGALRDR